MACLAGLVVTLQVHFLLSFGFFVGMLACAFVVEGAVRAVGRAGLNGVRSASRGVFRPGPGRRRDD